MTGLGAGLEPVDFTLNLMQYPFVDDSATSAHAYELVSNIFDQMN